MLLFVLDSTYEDRRAQIQDLKYNSLASFKAEDNHTVVYLVAEL